MDLRYVSRPDALGTPDLIILPGTKNTMADLTWLRQSGMEEAIRSRMGEGRNGADENGAGGTGSGQNSARPVLFGICGGFQMLGKELSDPEGVETGRKGEYSEGLGFLDAATVFEGHKRRTQVRGKIGPLRGALAPLSGMEIEGYEIHMGSTKAPAQTRAFSEITDLRTGSSSADGLSVGDVYGTYVHGIFDAPGVALRIAESLAGRKGLVLSMPEQPLRDNSAYKETQYDLLADTLRRHLDLEKVYEILKNGV